MRVEVDGIEYEMEVHAPACGFWHYHNWEHPDGTPGQPQHHHHDERCSQRTALLRQVGLAVQRSEGADLYRERVNGDYIVYSAHEH